WEPAKPRAGRNGDSSFLLLTAVEQISLLSPKIAVARCVYGVRVRMRLKWFLSLQLCVYLLASTPLFGQSNYGVIEGTVTDAQHLPIAGVSVQLTAAGTRAVRRVVTNQQGIFEAPALLPDDYELKA